MSQKSNPRCPYCKGQFSSGGTYRQRIPLGFGFAEDSNTPRFQVDVIEITGYTGFCMDCGKDGRVEISRKHKTVYPRSINRKIRAQRA